MIDPVTWPDEAHDPLMGSLPVDLQNLLREHGYRDACLLESAFDNEPEAMELLASLPGTVEVRSVYRRWSKELVAWQLRVSSSVKRVRRRIAAASVDEKVSAMIARTNKGSASSSGMLPTTVLQMCQATHWKTRRSAKLSMAAGPQERADIESREKARWTERVVGILRDAKAPVIQQASLATNPEQALLAIVGKKRSRTLRSRVRTWQKVRTWLTLVLDVEFPLHVGHMLDYLHDLELGYCAKSYPRDVGLSLAFFEKVGGFAEPLRISNDALWKSNLECCIVALQGNPGGLQIKKAPMYSVSMIIACELYVVSARPAFIRMYVWCKLLKVWMCLRWDDLQGLVACRTTLSSTCLRSILGRSKTTGAGKKTGEVPCFVRRDAGFTGNDWLKVGFDLFKREENSFARDYFLPAPAEDLEGFQPRMLDYNYATALSRKLLLTLKKPVRDMETDGWKDGPDLLIIAPAHLFHTEHSERHFAPSVSAVLKVAREPRNYLGRWGINAPQQSADYVLTSRQIILGVQETILSGLSSGPSVYDEEDLFDQYRAWLFARDPLADPETQIERYRILIASSGGNHTLQQQWPLVPTVVDLEAVGAAGVQAEQNLPADSLLRRGQCELDEDTEFWASVGRSGFRRLHRTGGCITDREACAQWVPLTAAQAQVEKSDQACKLCWPDLVGAEPEDMAAGSSSGDSSDSESSSTEARSVEPPAENDD